MNALEKWNKWLNSKNVTTSDKKILQAMSSQEIKASFSRPLAFGTAGIRRYMGLGSAKLNEYTIKMITYAWIKSLEKNHSQTLKKPLLVARDGRQKGFEFARIVAEVISGLGYQVLMFKNNKVMPTPILSFTIRDLNLGGGACITASHNPPQFNGIKCFTNQGQHLMERESWPIQFELSKIDINTKILMSKTHITYLDEKYEEHYLNAILKNLKFISPKTNLKIAFSPQHGASYELGPKILKKAGFNFIKAPKQSLLDSNFTHTLDPNPENPLAFNELIAVGKKNQVDLLLTTDPDGDRIALGVFHNHNYRLINGHEMAAIIVEHLLFQKSNANLLTTQSSIVKSVVTTSLLDQICKHYNVQVIKTLTGFKYLGEAMKNNFPKPFIGIEESYGAALFPHLSLDKDSLQLLPFVADMTSYYKAKGKTLVDVLESLYKKYGYYISVNEKMALKSKDIPKEWATIQSHFLKITAIGPLKVKKIEDFKKGIGGFDKTQLLVITFNDNSWIALRPSGTEALIRIYFCLHDQNKANAQAKFLAIKNYLAHL